MSRAPPPRPLCASAVSVGLEWFQVLVLTVHSAARTRLVRASHGDQFSSAHRLTLQCLPITARHFQPLLATFATCGYILSGLICIAWPVNSSCANCCVRNILPYHNETLFCDSTIYCHLSFPVSISVAAVSCNLQDFVFNYGRAR